MLLHVPVASLSEKKKWGSWYPRGPPLCLQPINKTKKASNRSAAVNGHNITSPSCWIA